MNINALTLSYAGINFNALAVADMSREQWVSMASEQYFNGLNITERRLKLIEVYGLCLQLKKDNQPKYKAATDDLLADNNALPDTGRKQRTNIRSAVKASDEDAADNTNS